MVLRARSYSVPYGCAQLAESFTVQRVLQSVLQPLQPRTRLKGVARLGAAGLARPIYRAEYLTVFHARAFNIALS